MNAAPNAQAGHDSTGTILDSLLVPRPYQVIAKRLESYDVTTLHVVPSDGGKPPAFKPAQVGMVGAFGVGEAALSISSEVDQRSQHSYTIRRAGPITNALIDTPIGGMVTVERSVRATLADRRLGWRGAGDRRGWTGGCTASRGHPRGASAPDRLHRPSRAHRRQDAP